MKLKKAITEYGLIMTGDVKPKTRSWYLQQTRSLLAYFGNDKKLGEITASELRQWRLFVIEEKNYKPSTINHYIGNIKRFFEVCVKEKFLEADPAASLKRIQETEPTDKKAIDQDDFLRILNHAAGLGNVRNVAIILFLYGTGCRVSGLCNLTLENLDLVKNQAWVIEKGQGDGKGRWVYLDQPVHRALEIYIYGKRPTGKSKKVFLNNRGAGLSRQAVWLLLKRHAEAAGVSERFNPHAMRHAFAIGHLKEGQSIHALSQLLGHTRIETTYKFYGKFEEAKLKELHDQHSPIKNLILPSNKKVKNHI